MTKIISILNHKGGVGKTTTSASLAAALSLKDFKVLAIDLDPQANLTQSLGHPTESPNTIYGALRGAYQLPILNHKENFDIVLSTLDLSAAEIELSSEPGREFILRDLIEPVKNNYDFILIDCPPSLGLLTLNALSASTSVLIPVQAQYLAIQGMAKLFNIITKVQQRLNKLLQLEGIVITQFNKQIVLNRDIFSTLQKNFPDKVFSTVIRTNIALAEAPAGGKDIFEYNPKSTGAQDYLALCEELLKK